MQAGGRFIEPAFAAALHPRPAPAHESRPGQPARSARPSNLRCRWRHAGRKGGCAAPDIPHDGSLVSAPLRPAGFAAGGVGAAHAGKGRQPKKGLDNACVAGSA